jgi:hypothetical protein
MPTRTEGAGPNGMRGRKAAKTGGSPPASGGTFGTA